MYEEWFKKVSNRMGFVVGWVIVWLVIRIIIGSRWSIDRFGYN